MSDWSEAERHVERAHEHFEAGRWDEAASALREALAINPDRAEWHFNLALTLEAAGRWSAAVDALKHAHRLDASDAQTILLIGLNSLRCDQPRAAIPWIEEARSLDATRNEASVLLIEALARDGRHDEAEVAFYEALQLEEADRASAYANIAESLMDRGDFERAVYCLRESTSLDPTAPRAHARLGYAYAQTGRLERARQLYMRELRDNPGDADTLLDLAELLIDMNRLSEASEKLRRVLEQETDNVDAHFSLAQIAERQHREGEAISSYSLVLRLDPDHPQARRRLALLYLRRKRVADARKLLRRDMRAFRREAQRFGQKDLTDLGDLLLRAGLPGECVPVFRRLAELRPDSAEAWHLLSVAYFETGERSHGIAACRRALSLDPRHLAATHNMVLASIHDRRWPRAAAYLRQALQLAPDDPGLRRLRLLLRARRSLRWALWLVHRALRRDQEEGVRG